MLEEKARPLREPDILEILSVKADRLPHRHLERTGHGACLPAFPSRNTRRESPPRSPAFSLECQKDACQGKKPDEFLFCFVGGRGVATLMAYSWLCIQGPLQAVLRVTMW